MINHNFLGGYVTSSKDFLKSHVPDENGIFSQKIFGPILNLKCICGITSGYINNNVECANCGVVCGHPNLRETTFGKIKTLLPFIKPTKINKILNIIGKNNNKLVQPKYTDYSSSITKYLCFNIDKIVLVDDMSKVPSNTILIPYRITGIFSLYIVFRFLNDIVKLPKIIEIFDDECFTNILPVIPAKLREPTYDVEKKVFHTLDLNKNYLSILRMNNHNLSLQDDIENEVLNSLELIRTSVKERIEDQDIILHSILNYDKIVASYQYRISLIYDHVYEQLSGKYGLIRGFILGKNLEFSARSVVRADPSLPPYQIKVSQSILKKIWLPYFIHYLIMYEKLDAEMLFQKLILNNEIDDFFKQDPTSFKRFLTWYYDYSS